MLRDEFQEDVVIKTGGKVHITQEREIHYDHIVSLADNGINDVSNLQISCQLCNLNKNKKSTTSTRYQQWYEMK
jgi:5-methylcytosine-specific restriction endonuclease McrA